MTSILSVRGLKIGFRTQAGKTPIIRDVSFDLNEGEILGIVGETGAGKSVTGFSICGLLSTQATVDGGEIVYKGRNLLELSEKEMLAVRGREISMIFQRYREALNPVFTIGSQLISVIRKRQGLSDQIARAEAVDLLDTVGIERSELVMKLYSHQLSGGMCQRVVIALAFACKPTILIADELATGLDVVIQARIMEMIKDLVTKAGVSAILISHDLAVVSENCDSVVVLYRGQVAEKGEVDSVINNPLHPYTNGLVDSVKLITRGKPMPTIAGNPPNIFENISGCAFHPRCSSIKGICKNTDPTMSEHPHNHSVRCHLHG